MKTSKDKIKRIGLFLLIVALAVIEFGLDLKRVGGGSRKAFMLFLILAITELFRDIRRAAKQTRQEEIKDETVWDREESLVSMAATKTTVSALGGLDWMLRKINPDYDPEAERNARKLDSAAVAKLDEMKSAGLIDEEEYQKRKHELAGK